MMREFYPILIVALLSFSAFAQTKIKDRTIPSASPAPHPGAILELESNNKGLLTPKTAFNFRTDITTISNSVAGLLIYNTGEFSLIRSVWLDNTNNITIYHNPVKESVNIAGLKGYEEITVYDATARLIHQIKVDNADKSIPLNTLSEGISNISIF